MSPRPDVSAERRAQILQAATAVFARQGFNGARMDDIVAESGLSKGALYWYFDSKEEIIAAILEQVFDREVAGLNELLAGEGNAESRLRLLARQAVADLDQMVPLLPISFEFYAVAGRKASVRQKLSSYFRQYHSGLTQLIQAGIDAGDFAANQADAAATALIAQFEGLILLWAIDPESFDFPVQVEAALELFLQGLKHGSRTE